MIELDILDWIQGASPFLDTPMKAVSFVTTYAAVWFVLAFLLTCSDRYRKAGVAVIVSIFVTFIVVDVVMKPLIGRTRPFEIVDFPLIVDAPTSFSFPSGHTSYAFAASVAIFIYWRKAGILALCFACVVGFSRMYLYVHWPTDVLAGAVVGTAIAIACVWFMSRYIPYYRELQDPRLQEVGEGYRRGRSWEVHPRDAMHSSGHIMHTETVMGYRSVAVSFDHHVVPRLERGLHVQ